MLGYFILFCIVAVIGGLIYVAALLAGRKRLAHFPSIKTVNVQYRDRQASGWSTKSLSTKLGGSSGVIDIVVTDEEFWLKCSAIYAGIKASHDLIYRIPLRNIKKVGRNDRAVEVTFETESGNNKSVTLRASYPDKLHDLLKRKGRA